MADQDFDFDEIDKAVNGQPNSDSPAGVLPSNNVENSTPAPSSDAYVPRPNSGRFMDVMHPSSDMRTNSGVAPVSSQPTQALPPSIPPAPVQAPEQAPASELIYSPTLTPFLPDANEKVEKRPLGGPISAIETQQNQTQQESEQVSNETVSQAPAVENVLESTPGIADSSVASEFNNLAGGQTSQEGSDQSTVEPVVAPSDQPDDMQRLQHIESQEVVETTPETAPEPSAQSVALLTSQESEISSPRDSAPLVNQLSPIYDVNDYHQPLQQPAKQKSGWLKVFVIGGIILLSAGLAAAVYFIFVGGP